MHNPIVAKVHVLSCIASVPRAFKSTATMYDSKANWDNQNKIKKLVKKNNLLNNKINKIDAELNSMTLYELDSVLSRRHEYQYMMDKKYMYWEKIGINKQIIDQMKSA